MVHNLDYGKRIRERERTREGEEKIEGKRTRV